MKRTGLFSALIGSILISPIGLEAKMDSERSVKFLQSSVINDQSETYMTRISEAYAEFAKLADSENDAQDYKTMVEREMNCICMYLNIADMSREMLIANGVEIKEDERVEVRYNEGGNSLTVIVSNASDDSSPNPDIYDWARWYTINRYSDFIGVHVQDGEREIKRPSIPYKIR